MSSARDGVVEIVDSIVVISVKSSIGLVVVALSSNVVSMVLLEVVSGIPLVGNATMLVVVVSVTLSRKTICGRNEVVDAGLGVVSGVDSVEVIVWVVVVAAVVKVDVEGGVELDEFPVEVELTVKEPDVVAVDESTVIGVSDNETLGRP